LIHPFWELFLVGKPQKSLVASFFLKGGGTNTHESRTFFKDSSVDHSTKSSENPEACTYSHDPRAPIELESSFVRPVSKVAVGRVGMNGVVVGHHPGKKDMVEAWCFQVVKIK